MKSIKSYIEDAAKITGSDRQTAIKIGCSPQYLSNAKNGKIGFSDKYSFKLAELIKVDERLVLAAAQYGATEDKAFWKTTWERVSHMVAGFLVAIITLPFYVNNSAISIMLSNGQAKAAR
jgi:hypothetical protein